jgi:hypothetical protein
MNKITSYELSTALDELRQTLGENFQLDENGSCSLSYKNELPLLIQFFEDTGRLVFGSEFRSGLENAPGEEWLATLSWDWMGLQSNGCALSPDFKSGIVFIWRDVRSTALDQELADFLSDVLASKKAFDEANLAAK